MAEARQAVAFQFAVTDEGHLSFRYNAEALKSVVTLFGKQYRKRYAILRNRFLRESFPASPLSLIVITFMLILGSLFGYDFSLGWVWLWDSFLFFMPRILPNFIWNFFLQVLSALTIWYLMSLVLRQTLKLLLSYQGWMLERHKETSLKTKLWAVAVKFVSGQFFLRPMLNSYQTSLPSLPVPKLADTLDRYLASVRPLLGDEEFQEMAKLTKEFKSGPGKKLQWYLYLKSWWSSNYVTDWWESYVYLYGRSPIMINSNYYACDCQTSPLTHKQSARAAFLMNFMMILKKNIETEKLRPLVIRNLVPLCSNQYERLFGTTRLPGKESDSLHHFAGSASNYVVIYKNGLYYKLNLYYKGHLLTPAEIQKQIEYIQNNDASPGPGEEKLPALTAENRTTWSNFYQKHLKTGENAQTMDILTKAAFFVVLEDGEPQLEVVDGNSEPLSDYTAKLLHGNGYNRWFDKSYTLIFFKNGKMGVNAEHSWADAPIVGHLLEYGANLEFQPGQYTEEGDAAGTIREDIPLPKRLRWEFTEEAVEVIDAAVVSAKERINDLDLYVMEHSSFGKGSIKKFKMSPDSYIQLALQLAFYRDYGRFCLTYEASMTRLFLHGRTETVRSCTIESANFVKAFEDPSIPKEEKLGLLRTAAEKHVSMYMNAMMGKGVDRHLFCLYVLSRYFDIKSPFLDKVLGEPWRLSTSQTPTQQTGFVNFNKEPWKISSGGGFGPVTKDGYGVSYIIPGDSVIYFHVSSFKSSSVTDSRRFAANIAKAMKDLKDLCESK